MMTIMETFFPFSHIQKHTCNLQLATWNPTVTLKTMQTAVRMTDKDKELLSFSYIPKQTCNQLLSCWKTNRVTTQMMMTIIKSSTFSVAYRQKQTYSLIPSFSWCNLTEQQILTHCHHINNILNRSHENCTSHNLQMIMNSDKCTKKMMITH